MSVAVRSYKMINLNHSHIHNYNTPKNTKTQHIIKYYICIKKEVVMAMSVLVPVTDYHITNFISNNVVFMQIFEM